MPELPEVEMARRLVLRHAIGRRVIEIDARDSRMQEGALVMSEDLKADLRVRNATRHGKHLFLDLGRINLHIHLGMSGSLHYLEDEAGSLSHERLTVALDRGRIALDDPRRFGRFGLVSSMTDFVEAKGLGPDALDLPSHLFAERLRGRRGAVKPLLLDQRVVAGVGNLYADEALFQVGIHPKMPVMAIPDDGLMLLADAVKRALGTSIDCGTDFDLLPEGYLLRQRRRDGPCPRCGHSLQATIVGGRTSVFCSECQGTG